MTLLSFFRAAFLAVSIDLVFMQDLSTPFQQGQLQLFSNTTLNIKYETNIGWKLPSDKFPKWFEYYNNTSHFKNMKDDTAYCSSVDQNFVTLSEEEGLWVACQDADLPDDCTTQPSSPCYPILTYYTGLIVGTGMRTLKLTFALYGFATLRLSFEDNIKTCFDFSKREDPFSKCEYYEVDKSMETDGWTFMQFTFEPFSNVSFNRFSLEMISRFAKDVVLIDKIEATEVLMCGEVTCPTTTTTTTPRTTTTTNASTTTTTSTENGITDPDVWTTTKRASSSTQLNSCLALTFLTFIIVFHSITF